MLDNLQINLTLKDLFSNNMGKIKAKIDSTNTSLSQTANTTILLSQRLQGLRAGMEILAGSFSTLVKASGYMINLNRESQNLQTQLTSLISANSSNITTTGRVIDATEKWALSMGEAKKVLNSLKNTAKETIFSTAELGSAFSAFYAVAANQGSRDEALKVFDMIAKASQTAGKNIADLIPNFDALATGTVASSSEMYGFMSVVGLTNEELKKAAQNGELFDLLTQKLQVFADNASLASGTFDGQMARIRGSLNSLMGEFSKPIFNGLTNALKSVGDYLETNSKNFANFAKSIADNTDVIIAFGGALLIAKTNILSFSTATGLAEVAVKGLAGAVALAKSAFMTLVSVAVMATLYEVVKVLYTMSQATDEVSYKFNAVEKVIATAVNAIAGGISSAYANVMKFLNSVKSASVGVVVSILEAINSVYDVSGVISSLKAVQNEAQNSIKAWDSAIKANHQREVDIQVKIDGDLASKKLGEVSKKIENLQNKAKDTKISVDVNNIKNANKELENQLFIANAIGDSTKARTIQAEQLRNKLKEAGASAEEINKAMAKFDTDNTPKVATTKVKSGGGAVRNTENERVSYEQSLQAAVQYYEAISDLHNKEIAERELKVIELKRIGLNELQIKEYFNRKELENKQATLDKLKELSDEYSKNQNETRNKLYQLGGIEYSDDSIFGNFQKISDLYDNELENLNRYYENRLELIRQALQNEQLTRQEFAALENESQNLIYQQSLEQQRLKNDMYLATAGNALNGLVSLTSAISSLSDGKNKTALRAYQAMMVAKAMINTYTAASNAFATAGNPYLGAAMASIAIAQGMAQVAQIKAQKFHSGGYVSGNLKSDEVPAVLQTGEGVLSRVGMRNLDKLNNGKSLGGTDNDNGGIVIINAPDTSVFDKWANSYEGRRVIKNVVNG